MGINIGKVLQKLTIMSPYFIDFEAFQHGTEKYQMKELCIVDVDRPFSPLYYLFKSRTRWETLDMDQQRTYHYQSHNVHSLGWYEGIIVYCRKCVWREIQEVFPMYKNGIFYVMGKQKMDYLQIEFPKLNFCEYKVTMNTLPYLSPNFSCIHRYHGEHCACLKSYRLMKHYYQLPD